MDRKVFEQLCSLATDLSQKDRSSFYELLTPIAQAEVRSVVERSGQIGDTPEVAQALPSAVPPDDATEVFDAQEFVASGGLPTVEGYQITEELARGGMGVVYRAQNVTLNREVALKLMQEGQLARPQERLRFEREARSAAKLSHRNIVTVFEYGYAEGLAFLAMEFVHGPTLQNVLSKEPLQTVEAATILKDVAQAIGYAHDNGIVHRDLKPANILLQEGTTPRVTDFGLARGDSDQQLTATEAIMGTPSYMAPEQAAGRMAEVGRGSDIYALGATLYACLTGVPPHKAENNQLTLMMVLESPIRFHQQRGSHRYHATSRASA